MLFYGRLEAEEVQKKRLRIIVRHGWGFAGFKMTDTGTT